MLSLTPRCGHFPSQQRLDEDEDEDEDDDADEDEAVYEDADSDADADEEEETSLERRTVLSACLPRTAVDLLRNRARTKHDRDRKTDRLRLAVKSKTRQRLSWLHACI